MSGTKTAQKDLDHVITAIRETRDGDVNLVQVMKSAEMMLESVQSFFTNYDRALYAEMRSISDYIGKAKQEVGNLQANDLQGRRIPEAGRELDEIVKSTEQATDTIMEAAEGIMGIEVKDLKTYQAQVNDAVMAIFEACSFQDITGQRISKVVETLQYIEERMAQFSEALGVIDGEEKLTDEEQKIEQRKKDLFLSGPALACEARDQDDIDALMNGAKPKPKKKQKPASVKTETNPKPAAPSVKAEPIPKVDMAGVEAKANSQDDIDALFD